MLLPRHNYTLDDYFMVELESPTRHEFYKGEIFAMAGASVEHNRIVSNLHGALYTRLAGQRCHPFTSDLRVATGGGLYTYPDVSIVCGRVKLVPGRPDTATNPRVLFEVLSKRTRDYDCGDKFELYKEIETLQEYVLVDSATLSITCWRRTSAKRWTCREYTRKRDALKLETAKLAIPLSEIYRDVL